MSTYIKDNKPLEYDNAPDWLVAYLKYRLSILNDSPQTIMTYLKTLREFFQWYSIRRETGHGPVSEKELRERAITPLPFPDSLDVTRADIEDYLYFLADTLNNSEATRAKKLVTIRGYYEYLIDKQESLGIEFELNPTARIKAPKLSKKKPVYLSVEEQQALLASVSGENAVRDHAIILLFLSTGMRISEAVALNLEDVLVDRMQIRIRSGKGAKERYVNLTEPCLDALRRYKEEYRDPIQKQLDTHALFISRRYKKRLTARSVEQSMEKQFIKAGLGGMGYSPHKFRHTAATTLVKDGVDLIIIQKLLGHERPDTTEIYTQIDDTDIKKAIQKSSLNLLGGKANGF